MTKLCFASLLALAACTKTTTTTPPAQPRPQDGHTACAPSAEAVFQIDHKTDVPAQHATSSFLLYDSGLWRFTELAPGAPAGGTPTRKLEGCLAGDRVGKLVTAIDAAPWTMGRAEMTCMAYSATFIEYQVEGRHVWTERMCGAETLDDTSKRTLAELKALSAELVPAS